MDVELELVAASVALGHAGEIPEHLLLTVNASPALIMDDRFALLLDGTRRRLVIEITEHRAIEGPESLDVKLCAPRRQGVRLAIDDAGAGYAGLQRLVELHPEIVKLDLTLIRGIDDDIARTAPPPRRTTTDVMVRLPGCASGAEGGELTPSRSGHDS